MLKIIGIFVFWYPAIMSLAWIVGGVIFYVSNEIKKKLPLNQTPMVSVHTRFNRLTAVKPPCLKLLCKTYFL